MITRPTSQRAIALVIVLAFLVLISGIIVAFFLGITSEHRYAKTAADTANTQQLAESAVNVVMAQIVDATKGTNPHNSSSTLSWASQPGMIRTYDDQGTPQNYYKLYSSDQMVAAGNGFNLSTETPPPDWSNISNVGLYTDLNAPVLVPDPTGPIKPDPTKPDTYSAVYPIMDPNAEGIVDGFSLTSRPGFTDPGTGLSTLPTNPGYDPTQGTANATANPAPMPVKWLYVLKNGKIVSPTSASNGVVTIPGVTKDNPATGRIAFWTDDETSKVNINTASEGVYWDVPHVFSVEDFGLITSHNLAGAQTSSTPGLAICQPVQKEFQRYPGHPATTSLSAIFGNFGLPIPNPITKANANQFDPYYAMSPKVASGGSQSGTVLTTSAGMSGFTPLVPDTDRLYASIDELMFTPQVSQQQDGAHRITNPSTANGSSPTPTVLTKSVFEKTKFFLTAGSNAPEVTLFNTPRISIWPVWDPSTSNNLTAYDKLAQFCGTIGGQSYYFTRKNARSDTDDYAGIPRNQTLYQYLQALTGKNVPGFGGNFASKYSTPERDQILTLIFDYIRCTNLADSEKSTPPNASTDAVPFTPLFEVTDPTDSRLDPNAPYSMSNDVPDLFPLGAGEVVPIKIGSTMGVGRYLTVVEADLLFYGTHKTGAATDKFRAMLLLQFASPMQGMAGMRSSLEYTVTGMDQFAVQPTGAPALMSLHLPHSGTNAIELSDFQTQQGLGIGGVEGPAEGLYALGGHSYASTYPYDSSIKGLFVSGGGWLVNVGGNIVHNYPFFSSDDVSFAPAARGPYYFDFSGGTITITVATRPIPGNSTPSVVVQTITLNFPSGTFLMPTATVSGNATYDFNANRLIGSSTGYTLQVAGGAGAGPGATNKGINSFLFGSNDTVVGVQPGGAGDNTNAAPGADSTAGDYRMIAAMANVQATRYRAHNDYTTPRIQFAHGLMTATSRGPQLYTNTGSANINTPPMGKLAPIGTNNYLSGLAGFGNVNNPPYLPTRVVNGVTRKDGGPGDWDSGIGNTPDGAYMNKPDEGDTRLVSHTTDSTVMRYPYLLGSIFAEAPPGAPYFSPNRQVPSPLMFGSIPTGVQRYLPWQTLLFHPTPEDPTHPGNASPKDHLLADLFWMPVVEPYAISQPFSTAGKINLNYQILPFTYIKRQTGLNAVMKSTKFLAIPASDSATYKPNARDDAMQTKMSTLANPNRRQSIDIPATLQACDTKFANGDIYKSATEICELNLVPPGESQASMSSFWNANKLTGDNLREKPYVDLYPRLTTKSNTYTVHYFVQALQQSTAHAAAGVFVDPNGTSAGQKDAILGEYRGSTTLERYIDPNDPALPDFARLTAQDPSNSALNIDQYYKFRVTGTRRFAP